MLQRSAMRRVRPLQILDRPLVDEPMQGRYPDCSACETDEAAAQRRYFIALKDFCAEEEGQLSFKKNDILEVFSSKGRQLLQVRSEEGVVGVAPNNYLMPYDIEQEPWYYANMSRPEAERLLSDHAYPSGAFLVRQRRGDDSQLVLSLKLGQDLRHYIVIISPTGLHFLQGEPHYAFLHMRDLIESHSTMSGKGILREPLTVFCQRREEHMVEVDRLVVKKDAIFSLPKS